MNYRFLLTLVFGLAAAVPGWAAAPQHQLVQAKDGSGVVGYKDTPIQPWSGFHVHDPDRPKPPRVDPDGPGGVPSDAVVLFNGKDLTGWQPAEWTVADGYLVAGRGNLTTQKEFGDCQLHLEWQAPNPPQGRPFDHGNNGVFMLGLFEIQIFDTFSTKIYPDGQAAAVYSQTPPLVNACRPSGQWQTYDIFLTAPVYKDGKLQAPARLTMLHNGVLVHLNQEIYGASPHASLASYPSTPIGRGPIALMAHNNPVRFRNLWVRPLKLPGTAVAPK